MDHLDTLDATEHRVACHIRTVRETFTVGTMDQAVLERDQYRREGWACAVTKLREGCIEVRAWR